MFSDENGWMDGIDHHQYETQTKKRFDFADGPDFSFCCSLIIPYFQLSLMKHQQIDSNAMKWLFREILTKLIFAFL